MPPRADALATLRNGRVAAGPRSSRPAPETRMSIELSDDRRAQIRLALEGFFLEEFEMELSTFRADQLLDFLMETLGPAIYNQAVQDARAFMQRKLDDLEGDVSVPWRSGGAG